MSGEQLLQPVSARTQDSAGTFHGTRGLAESHCELLRVIDMCVLLGRSDRTVRRMHKRGDLPRAMPVSGPLCWSRRVVTAWLERK